ncbi:MAG TPA: hypothetical protein ENN84_03290 [Candidatus Marinimicrobia bacterium]|nr:hypothetical protein [Candidatus Neomarinimicrobiota bacterium]
MKWATLPITGLGLILTNTFAITANISSEAEGCLECHRTYTPGLVNDWDRLATAMRGTDYSSFKNGW